MFEKLVDFWDIVVFGVVLFILASLQLRHAFLAEGILVLAAAEGILALAAMAFSVGLWLAKKWGLIGVCITLILGIALYFAEIWFEPIITGDRGYILDNILKMIVAILLLMYIGRTRIEQRFS